MNYAHKSEWPKGSFGITVCCGSTLVDPNACPTLSDALSLDARRPKCIPYVLRCALARRLSIQMHSLCAQMRSRSTLVDPNAFPMCSNELSPDARRSKCVSIGPASDDTNQNRTDGLLSIHTNHDSRAFIFFQCSCSQNDEIVSFSSRSASNHFGTTRTPSPLAKLRTKRYAT